MVFVRNVGVKCTIPMLCVERKHDITEITEEASRNALTIIAVVHHILAFGILRILVKNHQDEEVKNEESPIKQTLLFAAIDAADNPSL